MSTLTTIRRNPSAALLGVQLLGLLLYPLMESSPSGRAIFGAFGLVLLAAAPFALVVSRLIGMTVASGRGSSGP